MPSNCETCWFHQIYVEHNLFGIPVNATHDCVYLKKELKYIEERCPFYVSTSSQELHPL